MQDKSGRTHLHWIVVLVVGLGLVIVFRNSSAARTDPVPAPPQDSIRLETRINQLEQRLYTMETSLRNLEQQLRLAGATARGRSDEDVVLLRTAIQTLQLRLADYECGLVKLDERTLAPAMRAARRKSGASTDPCRLNAETPLRFSERRE